MDEVIAYHERLAEVCRDDAELCIFHGSAVARLRQIVADRHADSERERRETILRMEVESLRAENATLLVALSRAARRRDDP